MFDKGKEALWIEANKQAQRNFLSGAFVDMAPL